MRKGLARIARRTPILRRLCDVCWQDPCIGGINCPK